MMCDICSTNDHHFNFDSKTIWKYVKSLNPKKLHNNITHLEYKNSVIENDVDIANTFNMHFTNIAESTIDNKLCNKDEGPSFDVLNKFVKSKLQKGSEKFIIPEMSFLDVKMYLKKNLTSLKQLV